jgi:ATP-dependent Clp protease ATP-binding subunit ClpX
LDKIIEKRLTKRPMGLAGGDGGVRDKSFFEKLGAIEPEDLSRFGMIPEFLGRLPVTAMLEELDEEALVKILVEPKNAITKQYKKLLSYDNIEIDFESDALQEIARTALLKRTGARGLGLLELR